jgi:hypothetical protein
MGLIKYILGGEGRRSLRKLDAMADKVLLRAHRDNTDIRRPIRSDRHGRPQK